MTDNQADQIVDLLERIYDRLGNMEYRLDTIDDRLINIDTNTSHITEIETVWDTEAREFRQPNEIIIDRLDSLKNNSEEGQQDTLESIDEKLGTLIDTVWDTESGEFRQPNEIIIDRLDSLKNNTDPLMSIESKIEEIERNTA